MIAMTDGGWILRSKMIWHKRASMPESVQDRLSRRYEPVYFFTKNPKYYFNLDAIRVPSQDSRPFNIRVRDVDKTSSQSKLGYFASDAEREKYDKQGIPKNLKDKGQAPQGMHADIPPERDANKAQDQWRTRFLDARHAGGPHDGPLNHPDGKNPGDIMQEWEPYSGYAEWSDEGTKMARRRAENPNIHLDTHNPRWDKRNPNGKNPGDILSLSPEPLPYDHFAAFPTALPKFCISASCPPGGLVLDPFAGSGSTLVAARALGMRYIGIELNPEYIAIAEDRLKKTPSPLEVYARE